MYTLYEIYKFNNKNNHIIVILELFYFFQKYKNINEIFISFKLSKYLIQSLKRNSN